jgi:hypothetical protein
VPLGSKRIGGSPYPPGTQGGQPRRTGLGSRPGLPGLGRVVGKLLAKLKRRKRVRVIVVEELPPEPERLLSIIEATWGTEARERLVTWIKTRCEEEGCSRDYDFCCGYCGKRLCKEHANYGEGRIIYCREHVNPDARLCYIVLVDRMR